MKINHSTMMKGIQKISSALTLALALSFGLHQAHAAVTAVNLGSAGDFAVIAGAGITVAGPVNSTVLNGDIGSFTTTTITGLGNVVLNGVNHGGDSITQQAKTDLLAAYNDASGRTETTLFSPIFDVGGLTLTSGVYEAPSSLAISGVLTLDGQGDPNAVWIFQIASTLITATDSNINLINGAQAANVFWQVGSSATIAMRSDFEGSILARESITVQTDAIITGRALALDGAVTFDNNVVGIPEISSSLLFGMGLFLALMKRRREK